MPNHLGSPQYPWTEAVAVVTGAGSGIGRALALGFAGRGARVIASDIVEARAEETSAMAAGMSGEVAALRCDVTQAEDFLLLRDVALERFGRIDVVVNNVGVIAAGAPQDIPVDEWRRVMEINFMSHVASNDVFLPLLIDQRRGHIINTSSVAAFLNFNVDRLPYATTKAAVLALSEGLRIYLAPFGVGVTCLCPAGVMTNIREQIRVFGEITMTVPELETVSADFAAEVTLEAVEQNRFFVHTDPRAADLLRTKAADVDAYLALRSGIGND